MTECGGADLRPCVGEPTYGRLSRSQLMAVRERVNSRVYRKAKLRSLAKESTYCRLSKRQVTAVCGGINSTLSAEKSTRGRLSRSQAATVLGIVNSLPFVGEQANACLGKPSHDRSRHTFPATTLSPQPDSSFRCNPPSYPILLQTETFFPRTGAVFLQLLWSSRTDSFIDGIAHCQSLLQRHSHKHIHLSTIFNNSLQWNFLDFMLKLQDTRRDSILVRVYDCANRRLCELTAVRIHDYTTLRFYDTSTTI